MPTLNLDDEEMPEEDDLGDLPKDWRFDPENPPDTFTIPMIRRLTLPQMEQLSKPDNGILNPQQQESFDAAYKEWWEPIGARLTKGISALTKDWQLRSPELSESMERLRLKLATQAELPTRWNLAGLPIEVRPPAPSLPNAGDFTRTFPPEVYEEATAGSYERDVDESSDQVALLRAMATLMEKQHLSATRTAFFALLVSVSVIVAGVAPIVAAPSWTQRLWILGATGVICLVAAMAYGLVRFLERKKAN